jgi:hypothetical protein
MLEVHGFTHPYELGTEYVHGRIICEHATALDFEMYWGNKPFTSYFYWVETEADVDDDREVVCIVPDEIVRQMAK